MSQLALPTLPQPAPGAYPTPLLRSLPLRERPAYRVAQSGANVCSAVELLAAIVGGPQQIEIAHALLARFGDLPGLVQASLAELTDVPGMGAAGAARLKAALEVGRRLLMVRSDKRPVVRSPSDVAQLLMAEMGHLEQEQFRVLFLDTRNRLLGMETLYVGSLNSTHIRVAEVFREATRRNCAAIIAVHNHPSSDCSPSSEDISVSRQLVAAGKLLDIELADHLIVSRQGFVSLREKGLGFDN